MNTTKATAASDIKTKYEKLRYDYLEYHDKLWDDATYKAESSKTKSIVDAIIRSGGGSGPELYKTLLKDDYKPYTIKAMFERASAMYAFGMKAGTVPNFNNPFEDFLIIHRSVFRNAYTAERLKLDFDEAKNRIQTQIKDENTRNFCMALLMSGLRINEAYKVNQETSSVIGKGGKQRFVMFNYSNPNPPSESKVRAELKKIGLKPHSLRKLLATKLARSNMTYTDICAVMGWSSLQTAQKYLQPLTEDKLKQKMEDILNG